MDKSPSAKINIVMLGLVLYFLFAQNFLGRIVFSPFLNSLDTTNFLPWLLHLLVANIPTYAPLLIYFLYKLFTKSKQGPAEALLIRRLSLKNVLYVVIMGSTVVLLFIWADYGISFIGGGTPQLEVLIMPLGRQLIVGAVVASVLGRVDILSARIFAADFCSFVVSSSLHTSGYAPRRFLEIAKNQTRKSTHQSMSTRPRRALLAWFNV